MDVVLVTGASGGIGEEIVKRLAERKHNLLLVARNAEKLKEQCINLENTYGISAQFIAADLSKNEAAQEVFEESRKRELSISMLINNAGVGSGGEFSSLSLQAELNLVQLNISSLVALTHLFLPEMQRKMAGTIVNIASMAAFMPVPYMATYAASKAFVRSFTEAVTQECVPYNIHMMLFCPGLTRTNFNKAAGINNDIGKGLNSDYEKAPAQTPEQVANEVIKALDRKKKFAVSGRLNRLAANMIALVPNYFIATIFGKSFRRKMNV